MLAVRGGRVPAAARREEVELQQVPAGRGRAGLRHRHHMVPARLLRLRELGNCYKSVPSIHTTKLSQRN